MIYLASDHGGYKLKEVIEKYLKEKGEEVVDVGAEKLDPTDDFTDFVIPLAKKVAENPKNLGVALCRNGVGVEVAANKIDGIRAALSWDPKHAASSRHDDNSNVLALPADYLNDKKAIRVLESWLSTPYAKAPRFERRLKKIEKEEREN
ncbi:RpiB/LacA/LacB family sugar-phosphate isomerase [Patescibacteria group bacterium]|nr:RpiB/LacA/LacB family sugar-phosphate isomerase [Patescibacteria group bacterium]